MNKGRVPRIFFLHDFLRNQIFSLFAPWKAVAYSRTVWKWWERFSESCTPSPHPDPVGIGIRLSSTRNLILLYNFLGTSWDEHYNDHRPWFSVGGQDRERGALGYQKVDVGGMSTPHPLSRKESLMEERIHGLHLIIVLWWWQENDRHIFGGVLKSFLK